jgi:hypothetical protein
MGTAEPKHWIVAMDDLAAEAAFAYSEATGRPLAVMNRDAPGQVEALFEHAESVFLLGTSLTLAEVTRLVRHAADARRPGQQLLTGCPVGFLQGSADRLAGP